MSFYLFTLPAWQIIAGWLLTLAVISSIVALVFVAGDGGERVCWGVGGLGVLLPWGGVSITGGFLLLVLAVRVYIGRFALLFEHHTIFDGVTYTDAHVTIAGLLFVCAALVIGAIIAFVSGGAEPAGALACRWRWLRRWFVILR